MLFFYFEISKNYAVDIQLFKKIRLFSDGISINPLTIEWHRYKGDHNPRLDIMCLLFNYCVFEIEIYNVNHAND